MKKTKAPVRVNYRPMSEEPERRCSDCFFFERTPGSDDGNCFGQRVCSTGVCDAFTAARGVEPGVTGK